MGSGRIREPAVAGSFYPADREMLKAEMERLMPAGETPTPERVAGAISPHAGWVYSGGIAGEVFASIEVPDDVILIGPNHRALGAPAAVDTSDAWEFPFGMVAVNSALSETLVDGSAHLEFDSYAHIYEHSLEVIVPFLSARNPGVRIAAISLYTDDGEILGDIASSVAAAARKFGALIVASSDMTHYLPDRTAREIDSGTIEVIKRLDETELLRKVKKDRSLCGGAPVCALIGACRELGAKTARLVRYATSGDVSGDRGEVVGYGGFTLF